jgi:regulator of nucleoside diphosphate kinase
VLSLFFVLPAALEMAMMERYEIVVSARDAEALAAMLAAHRRANRYQPDASDELADLLMDARLVSPELLPGACVALGSTVAYEEQPSGKRRRITLVLPVEADPAKARVSVLSPIGLALIGRQRGALVDVTTPNGKPLSVRILDTAREAPALARAA